MMLRTNALQALPSLAAAALLCTLSAPASAQEPAAFNPNAMVEFDYVHDTGLVSNDGEERQSIIAFPVYFEGTSMMTLRFDDVLLAGDIDAGDASIIRITSMLDGAVQTMNAVHVEQWENGTAYFNGDMVLVEVIASPGTGPNRLSVDRLLVGAPADTQETQCGPTDDRQPSNDQRVCRLMPVGCTAWVINDCAKCVLSAGHCGASGSSSIQFNVPFSTSNGTLVAPDPDDQYAVDGASMQSLNATDDWRYFGVFPNSNTGLTPYEAYGVAFDLANPPNPAGQNIRITGHGTDSTPNQTFNQKQQTHVGPFVSVGTNLNYQADTTGGSSGSPVIWEEMDVAIGIHTNGGCSTSGSGSNNGTPITSVSLQNALANPQGVCAIADDFVDLGEAHVEGPFSRPPRLGACGDMVVGGSTDLKMNLRVGVDAVGYLAKAFLIVGFTQIDIPLANGILVPFPDFIFQFPIDTSQTNDEEILVQILWGPGIPSGTDFFFQYWISYDDMMGDAGSIASNAIQLTWP